MTQRMQCTTFFSTRKSHRETNECSCKARRRKKIVSLRTQTDGEHAARGDSESVCVWVCVCARARQKQLNTSAAHQHVGQGHCSERAAQCARVLMTTMTMMMCSFLYVALMWLFLVLSFRTWSFMMKAGESTVSFEAVKIMNPKILRGGMSNFLLTL